MNGEDLAGKYLFRDIRQEEAEEAAEIERICFPPNEACTKVMMRERIRRAPELFLVAEERSSGKIAGFLCGLSTMETAFRDDFFINPDLYDPNGTNVMLLGLDVLPQYRRQGLARAIVECYKERETKKGRERLTLTCLKDKVGMYEKMGFSSLGISDSSWGGEAWYEMVCFLGEKKA